MSKSILYLARHGKIDGTIPGLTRDISSDPSLNSVGQQEAKQIGEYFKEKEIVPTIYTGTSSRSKQTGKIAAQIAGASVFVDPGLNSWNYGTIDLEEDLRPYQKNWDLIPPGGEPYKTFITRFRTTLVKYWLNRDPILLITHSRNLYYLQWIIDDLPEIPVSVGVSTGELVELKTKLKD